MKKYSLYLKSGLITFLLAVLFSCGSNKDAISKLTGTWTTMVVKKSPYHDNTYVLSFQDTSCIYLSPNAPYSKYLFKKDTLIINEPVYGYSTNDKAPEPHKFKVVKLAENELELKPLLSVDEELVSQAGRTASGTLLFKKLEQVSDIPFTKLAFFSTMCYGTCPAMYLELDNKGNLLLKAKEYTIKQGWYVGTLSKEDLQSITTLINAISLNELQPNYKADYTDAATKGILIEKDGKQYVTSVYGSSKEPMALRVLFNVLLQSYKKAILKNSDDSKDKVSYPDYYLKSE